jgi:AcrR family transcriptional regulator
MSPRPRTISDSDLLVGAARAIGRVGPVALTLADVGREVGLSPATLIQRFGSKRGLLLALAGQAADQTRLYFEHLREENASPLRALRAHAACFASMATDPAVLANHLAFLQMDLMDSDFRRHAREQAAVTQEALRALIHDARKARELVVPASGPTSADLARAVQVTLGGSLLAWGVLGEGEAKGWVRHDLDALLRPWLAAGTGRTKTARAGRP